MGKPTKMEFRAFVLEWIQWIREGCILRDPISKLRYYSTWKVETNELVYYGKRPGWFQLRRKYRKQIPHRCSLVEERISMPFASREAAIQYLHQYLTSVPQTKTGEIKDESR